MNGEYLTVVAWKATLILGAAAAVCLSLRNRPAALRHLIWITALVSVLLLPAMYLWMPSWSVAPSGAAAVVTGALPVSGAEAAEALATASASRFPWLAAAWGAGLLLALLRLASGLWRVARMSARAEPAGARVEACGAAVAAEMGLPRPVVVLTGEDVPVPMTWGVFRPLILLPRAGRDWTGDRLRVVLLHESTHIERGDWTTQILAEIARAVYWFHPLAWWGVREARAMSEQACDDAVLRVGTRAAEYAEHLLGVARSLRPAWNRPAAVAMALGTRFEQRLRSLLDQTRDRRTLGLRHALAAALLSVLVLAPLAAIRAQTGRVAGTLAGSVRDASGGIVPRARVIASNLDTGNRELTSTDMAGGWTLDNVPSGRYEIEIQMRGFKALKLNTVLEPSSRRTLEATLQIGQVAEAMDIVAKGKRAAAAAPSGAPQRVRVGGHVQATKLLRMARPAYPDRARQLGIEGTVLLQAVISREGSLLNLAPLNTLADPDLVKAAIDAVSQWKYQPTLLNGEPVEVITTITLNFRLEE